MEIKNNSQELLSKIFLARAKKEDGCIRCGRKIIDSFYKKTKKIKEYMCICSQHVSPMSSTPFHKTRVDLNVWFNLLNDILISKEGIDIQFVQKKYNLPNRTAWDLMVKLKEWVNMVEENEKCKTLSKFVKIEEKFREKFVLKYNQEFSPKQMQTKMLNILPPLFEHLREVKNAA